MTALLLALLLGVVGCSDGEPPAPEVGSDDISTGAIELSPDDWTLDLTDIPSDIEFWGSQGTWIFKIHEDGTVEVNPEIKLDEGSREFFDYLNETFPAFCKCP